MSLYSKVDGCRILNMAKGFACFASGSVYICKLSFNRIDVFVKHVGSVIDVKT